MVNNNPNDDDEPMDDDQIDEFITALDAVIFSFENVEGFAAHNVAAMLLSRVTLLMAMDPQTGKDLLKYVWEQLDEIQQANPGSMIP